MHLLNCMHVRLRSGDMLCNCFEVTGMVVLAVRRDLNVCVRSLASPVCEVYSVDRVPLTSRLAKGESTALHVAVRRMPPGSC